MKQFSSENDSEQHDFTWQEKVFSQNEIEWYRQKRDYRTFLENKYHQDVSEKLGTKHGLKRLYSRTEADISACENGAQSRNIFESSVIATDRENSQLRLRHVSSEKTERRGEGFKDKTRVVQPADQRKKKLLEKQLISHSQRMYIMADLRSNKKSMSDSEEVVLCQIEVDNNNILKISPDFSNESPYLILNNRNERFEYTIENVSQQPAAKDVGEEKELKKKIYQKYLDIVRSSVGEAFQMPPIEILKFFVFGEIASAYSFEGSNLGVFYYIHLPKNWSTANSSWLTGVTQTCKTTKDGNEEAAYFSFPLEGELTLALGNLDNGDISINTPSLLMEVLSYDYWGCVRTAGYGHTRLPILPGSYTNEVVTWKPIVNSWKSKMQNYFTGGLSDIEDLTYIAVPNTFEGKELSRLGFTTESSGTVLLRLNVVQQSRHFTKSGDRKHVLDQLSSKRDQDNISLVLSAFQRARQRMLAARQMIITSS